MRLRLKPAYGRKYGNCSDAIHDFRSNKDFVELKTGLYCNLEDCKNSKIVYVEILFESGNDIQKTLAYVEA